MGVVVRRYIVDILSIIINFPYSTFIIIMFILKRFCGIVYVIFLQYINKRYAKNMRDRSKKSRSREHNY